jgi:hypothetical protein
MKSMPLLLLPGLAPVSGCAASGAEGTVPIGHGTYRLLEDAAMNHAKTHRR